MVKIAKKLNKTAKKTKKNLGKLKRSVVYLHKKNLHECVEDVSRKSVSSQPLQQPPPSGSNGSKASEKPGSKKPTA